MGTRPDGRWGNAVRDVILGLLAIIAGSVFLLRGFLAMRIVIPIWGAFTGFALGAGAVAAVNSETFLAGATAWTVGAIMAVLFAAIAYFYYAFAVVLAAGSVGFSLGAGLMNLLNIEWTWVIVVVGTLTGLLLAILAVVADLPMILLVFITSLGGAAAVTTGLMLMVGAIESSDFTRADVVARIDDSWFWYLGYVVLIFVGIGAQSRTAEVMKESMRSAWEGGTSPTSV